MKEYRLVKVEDTDWGFRTLWEVRSRTATPGYTNGLQFECEATFETEGEAREYLGKKVDYRV